MAANILGPSQTLITPNQTFTFTEQQFIGAKGYERSIEKFPRLGITSVGNVNYKQFASTLPLHKFKWNLILPEDTGLLLIQDIESQIFEYKQNNARDFTAFVLEDFKLGNISININPVNTAAEIEDRTNVLSKWVFPRYSILITKIDWEYFDATRLSIKMEAVELP